METITIEETERLKAAGFRWREGTGGLRALACQPLEAEGFANLFSTRGGGVSPFPAGALNLAGFDEDAAANIFENRRRLLSLLEGAWKLSACWQVHGAEVRVARAGEDAASERERCDGVVTNERGLLVGVKTADCVPVLLGDARTGASGAVHAGWRGTLAGIVGRALAHMTEEFGTRAEDVRAAIGPAAGACCYEVGPEVVAAFTERDERAARYFTPTRDGHARADLQRANRQQLEDAGLRAERIHIIPLCTICRPDLFFSYRRERQTHGRTGRLMSVIGRRDG